MTIAVKECYTEAMRSQEERFHRLLAILASRCRTELDELEIEIYDRHLSPYGYDKVCEALEGILIERSNTDQFPAIGMILNRLGDAITQKSLAMDVTNRIAVAIRVKGYNWSDKVSDFENDQLRVLGEIGVQVVKRLGGWCAVIELANGNPGQYKTWIRDSAISVIESSGPKILRLPSHDQRQIEKKAK